MPQEDNQTRFDLSQFKLEPHVREALEIALRFAQGQPLSAANVLNSALVVRQRDRTSAFSTWQSFFSASPNLPVPVDRAISDKEATSPPANLFLAESFNVALPFFRENREFWGRDYVTLGLLALGDPSLDDIASAANQDIQSLRNRWFEFVSNDKDEGLFTHRPWAQWWRARGLPVPGDSAKDRLERPAYLLTWDPKRTPPSAFESAITHAQRGGDAVLRWSVGNHGATLGDRVFFMRQGDDKPGLIGAGFVVSEVIVGPHWDASKPKAWVSYFANIRWDTLGEIPLIPLPELVKATNEERLWIQEGSGLPIPRELTARLESILHDALRLQSQPTPSPTSVSEQTPTTPAETAPLADAAPAQPAQPTTATPERPVPNAPAAPQAAGIPDVPAAPKPPEEWVLSDRPLEDHFRDQDRFQFGDYASSLAAVLDHPKTETPFTMAIHAPWGAGKTTLANMIAEQLKQRPLDRGQAPHIICWFNAWMHDDATNLATALIAEVGRTADGFRGLYHRIFHPLPFSLLEPRSRNWRRAILLLLILAPTLALSVWLAAHLQHLEDLKKNRDDSQITVTVTKDASGKELSRTESSKEPSKRTDSQTLPKDRADRLLETFQSRMLVLSAFFTAVAGLLGFLVKAYTSTSLGGFVQSPDKAAETGAISSAEKQLRDLITQATWRGNRFVIFIDDIERCKPPRSIDVLDAVSQLLSQKGVIVVLLGDMSAVAAAAQLKYKDIAEIVVPSAGIAQPGPDRGKEAFGRLYLQKIIQFQFDLPIPPMDKIQDYMRRLVVPATEVPPTDVVQTEEVTHG